MQLNIKPTIGLGELKFGMTREQVNAVLGQPDEIEIISEDGEAIEQWHYDDHEFSCLFSEQDDWKLLSIAISNEDSTINEHKFIGLSETELEDKLQLIGISEELEYEDMSTEEFPDHLLVYCDELAMNFWLDAGIVSEIQWGPIMLDDENIDWPK
jgi:hypothetical protein